MGLKEKLTQLEPSAVERMLAGMGSQVTHIPRDRATLLFAESQAISLKRIADVLDWWQTATLRGDI